LPFEIPNGKLSLRAQVFRNGKAIGRLIDIPKTDLDLRIK
jgi:hypothetical protein